MIGKGGHVGSPHESVDPVTMAGMVIMAGQTIISRRIDPLDPTIISFGTVHGGTASNIIPDEVTLTGSIRTLNPDKREELADHLHSPVFDFNEEVMPVGAAIHARCASLFNIGQNIWQSGDHKFTCSRHPTRATHTWLIG